MFCFVLYPCYLRTDKLQQIIDEKRPCENRRAQVQHLGEQTREKELQKDDGAITPKPQNVDNEFDF